MIAFNLHNKAQGEWAELCFAAQCLLRGYAVAQPFGDSRTYDFLVESGRGFISRVQVKSVSRISPDGSYHVAVMRSMAQAKKAYRMRDFDLLAAYLIPCDTWYIIPVRFIVGIKAIALHPGRHRRRLEKFRDAWPLLQGSRDFKSA